VERHLKLAACVALVAAVAFSGCTRVDSTSPASGLHASTHRDTVRIGMWEEPHTLDPVVSTMSFENDVYQLEYDGLVTYDGHAHVIPDLARELPTLANGGISRDGLTLTYHMLPAKWHDGVPLTSADVVYTWQQIMNPKNNTDARTGYDRIASIEAPDPETVRIHLRAPYAPAIYLFANGAIGSIVPKHVLSEYANLNATAVDGRPVGSGPYIFRSWTRGAEMRFDANPNYFRGVAKIAHVVIRFIPDQNTLVNALRAHDVDLYDLVSTTQAPRVRALPGVTFVTVPSYNAEGLTFNTQRAPLDELPVRLALAYAMDESAIFHNVYHGLGGQGPTDIAPGLLGYDPAIHYYPYDPKRAGALLDAAGWTLGPNGMRSRNGKPLAIEISSTSGNKLREELQVLLQRYWRAVGVDATVKNYAASTFFAPMSEGGPLYAGRLDIAIYTGSHAWPDPDVENTLSPDRLPPAGQNTSRFQNATMGRLIRAGLASYDPAVRAPIYSAIARIEIANLPNYILSWEPQNMAADSDLHGLAPSPISSDLWNIAQWTFSP
jgi:peptide/nickel transport system substrate-binding protein